MNGDVKEQEGVVNICCPCLLVVFCPETDQHNHLKCRLMGEPIPNEHVVNWCVSVGKWRECVLWDKVVA